MAGKFGNSRPGWDGGCHSEFSGKFRYSSHRSGRIGFMWSRNLFMETIKMKKKKFFWRTESGATSDKDSDLELSQENSTEIFSNVNGVSFETPITWIGTSLPTNKLVCGATIWIPFTGVTKISQTDWALSRDASWPVNVVLPDPIARKMPLESI